MTQSKLLEMKIGQSVDVKFGVDWILRVPGGWIYYHREVITRQTTTQYEQPQIALSITSQFVPEPPEKEVKIIQFPQEHNLDATHNFLNRSINEYLEENYDEPHRKNSIKKHLSVEKVEDCKNIRIKMSYLQYLKGRK